MSDENPTYTATGDPHSLSDTSAVSSGGMTCPECGAELENMNQRQKHAVAHYGEDLIPPYPSENLAAERKAALLDVQPDTLRGFPRRRY